MVNTKFKTVTFYSKQQSTTCDPGGRRGDKDATKQVINMNLLVHSKVIDKKFESEKWTAALDTRPSW